MTPVETTTGPTEASTVTEDVAAQLREIETDIDRLKREASGLSEQVGGQEDGPQDDGDTAAALTNAEESEAIIATLEQRRDALRAQLGEG